MSEGEEYHDSHMGDVDSEGEEVAFKTTAATSSTPLITRSDLEEIIEGWKEKFRRRESIQGTDRISLSRPLLTRTHLQGPRAAVWTMTSANDLRTRMNMETAATPSTYRLTTVAG